MKTRSLRCQLLAGALVASSLLVSSSFAMANVLPLAPHRAGYELTLLSVKGKAIAAASGRIGIEFTGNACEGYATNFRQLTQISDGEGQSRLSEMRLTSFETADGKGLTFKGEKRVNGGRPELTDGQAERAADGGLSIDVRQPKPTKMDVDGVAIFPTDHMMRLIAAAKKGDRILGIKVYDGSDGGEKVYDTTAVIGNAVPATGRPVEEASQKAGLANMTRWPVSISYFEPGQGERTPVYVLGFDLYENGVSGALKLDFGEFSLKGQMTRLEMLKETACAK
ncbi:MAG: cell envelope integrity EipB family protein [Beijerinckiaceae bacterium]